jgi:hypothetical protein
VKNNFFDLLSKLVKDGVDFVIVGGFAGVVHGCTYVTQDIDICCDFSVDNLLRLQRALFDIHPVHRMTPKRPALELTEENCVQYKNLYLDTDIGRLDCLSIIDGIGDYDKVKEKAVPVKIEDVQLFVLGLDALIQAKKAMNRPRDKEALLQLEAIKKIKQKPS